MENSPSLPRPSDRWIPWYFVAFFVALILVLVPMGIIAVRTNTGLVTEGAYEKGLTYNQSIQADEQQKALNWHGQLTFTPSSERAVMADFVLNDSFGQPLKNADVTLWLVRPTQAGIDQRMNLSSQMDGHYSGNVSLPVPGLWEARISAMYQGKNYQLVKRVSLP